MLGALGSIGMDNDRDDLTTTTELNDRDDDDDGRFCTTHYSAANTGKLIESI